MRKKKSKFIMFRKNGEIIEPGKKTGKGGTGTKNIKFTTTQTRIETKKKISGATMKHPKKTAFKIRRENHEKRKNGDRHKIKLEYNCKTRK